MTNANEIVITRVIDAPRERVFRAFTEPSIVEWWGPNGFTTTTHERNVTVGGIWRFTMHGPDGADYENFIKYVEIKKPEFMKYSHGESEVHPDGFNAHVSFVEEGNKTKVTLHLILPTKEEHDRVVKFGAIEGGNQTLARLARYMEENP